MDSAQKQDAIVAEVTQGTTPTTPSFLLMRASSISGSATRARLPSPERRPNRTLAFMANGLNSYGKQISMPFNRDAATDVLWQSLFFSSFSGTPSLMKNGVTASFFTFEEKFEGGATDFYLRHTGCQVNSLGINFRLGQIGEMTWGLLNMGESNATAAISGATYAVPTPAVEPVSTVDITVSALFAISSPKVTGLSMQIVNNLAHLHKFGDDEPFGIGAGMFDVRGQVELYFDAAAQYTDFLPGTSKTMSLVFGASSGNKDQIDMAEVDVFDPIISDPGPSGQHIITLSFMGRYDASDASVIKLTRNVT